MNTLHLLGSARIERPAGRIGGSAAQRHRVALLAYLALARGKAAPREKLMALLWPEQGDASARHLLNVSVHVLRKALGDDALHTEGLEIRLNAAVVESDVDAFRAARANGDLAKAADVYGGPFMDGFFLDDAPQFGQWQEMERARIVAELEEVLHGLAERAEQAGDWREAVSCWRRLAAEAPQRAEVMLRLMRALDAAGDRADAIQVATSHATLLRDEYDAEPSAEVVALREQLRTGGGAVERSSGGAVERLSGEAVEDRSSERDSHRSTAPPLYRSRIPRLGRIAAMAIAAAIIVVGATAMWGRGSADRASVAVLPFLDLSAGKDQSHLSDGITEELLNALTRVRGLKVAARSSAFQFRDPGVDIRDVGKRLNVAAVVEGSVRLDGDRLRVTAQLIDSHNGFHIWSQQFDRKLADAFAIQEEIANDVASALSANLPVGVPHVQVARATSVPEAYQLYLKGRQEWNRRSRDGILRATEAFEEAVKLDPSYAAAWAGLADAYQLLPDYADLPARQGLSRAKAAALRAIGLDSTLASAHTALGAVLDDYDRDRAGSEREYRTAIQLNPGYATARQWLAIHLADDARFPDAIDEIERARRLDPLSPIITTAVGAVKYFARDYDGAIAEYRTVLRDKPTFAIARALMGRVMLVDGRAHEAVEALRMSVEQSGGDPSYRAVYAAALAAAGLKDSAVAVARGVETTRGGGYVPFTELASAYIYLGDDAKALALFERAFDERDPAVKHMRVEPLYDRLRAHPRFQAVLRRAGHF